MSPKIKATGLTAFDRAAALPLLVAAIAFLAGARRVAGTIAFPLDDTWIHLRLAANMAAGHGFAINPGEPVACSTAPLWTLILAGLSLVGHPGVATAIVPSLILAFTAVALLHRLLRERHGEWIAFPGAVAFGLLPSVVWSAVSGLEVPLFLVLEIGALILIDRTNTRARLAGVVLLALATQVRPEGALLLGLGVLLYYVRLARERRESWGLALAPMVTAAAIIAPYALFCLHTIGRPLPSTFYAKTTGLITTLPTLDYLRFAYGLLGRENLVVAALAAIGSVAVIGAAIGRRARAIDLIALGWVLALPLAYASMGRTMLFAGGAGNFGRYLYILLPAWIILAANGAQALVIAAARIGARAPRVATAAITVAAIAGGVPPLRARAELYTVNVSNIEEMQVAAGRWIRDNLPAGSTVAVNDLGAIAFFSGHRVLDLVGIATPAVLGYRTTYDPQRDPLNEMAVARYLADARPPFLAVFPDWYPRLFGYLESRGALRRLHQIRIRDNRTCGSDLLVIVEVAWPGTADSVR